VFLIEEPADVGLEDPTLALGHDKAEGLHQSADLDGFGWTTTLMVFPLAPWCSAVHTNPRSAFVRSTLPR
jgi:hypothetical protein